ncbi:hypothetical protein Fmac_015064 [Flemingia macrophylla]|uniref:Glycosyl transferase family 1 domain-containing protein n=1 Tax=Flemingia macrophylla TaxID=520843 RepID=A0ABD1MDI2_9FABA
MVSYDGIIVSSFEAKGAFSCFLHEPFKSIPRIWIIHENALAYRSRQYTTKGQIKLLNDWRRVFNRSTVVVFPNYALPTMAHSLKYPRGFIEHIAGDLNVDSVLDAADVVIYGSFLEEQSFPKILIRAMTFEKPIIAPDVPMIRKYAKTSGLGPWADCHSSLEVLSCALYFVRLYLRLLNPEEGEENPQNISGAIKKDSNQVRSSIQVRTRGGEDEKLRKGEGDPRLWRSAPVWALSAKATGILGLSSSLDAQHQIHVMNLLKKIIMMKGRGYSDTNVTPGNIKT